MAHADPRWHSQRHTVGCGHVYQGPVQYKFFIVQCDAHFLTVCRYVQRNAQRANLVPRAELGRWSSLWRWKFGDREAAAILADWPVARPGNWVQRVNQAETQTELDLLQTWTRHGRPCGSEVWVTRAVRRLGLETTVRPRGRPPKDTGRRIA